MNIGPSKEVENKITKTAGKPSNKTTRPAENASKLNKKILKDKTPVKFDVTKMKSMFQNLK
jgi:hypothetical protein